MTGVGPASLRRLRKSVLFLLVAVAVSLAGAFLLHHRHRQSSSPTVSPSPVADFEAPLPSFSHGGIRVFRGSVKPGISIVRLFAQFGVSPGEANRLVRRCRPVYHLRLIKAGHHYRITMRNDHLFSFRYYIDPRRYLQVIRWNDSFYPWLGRIPRVRRASVIRGHIDSSLFQSILDLGEDGGLADHLAAIFAYDIDFNRDIRQGDSYLLLVDRLFLAGRFAEYGPIRFAQFHTGGKTLQVVLNRDREGNPAYFHPDGRAVRKLFLRCPLPFMRITSGFGRRYHPVLGFSARHRGIDLQAPAGTPVRTTAGGIILHTGMDRQRGNHIIIRHPNRYTTHYYHLSRFEPGVRAGTRVRQGQRIGYVGNTGWSTGPHLHYGITRNRRFINPLNFNRPARPPLRGKELRRLQERYETLRLEITLRDRYPSPIINALHWIPWATAFFFTL